MDTCLFVTDFMVTGFTDGQQRQQQVLHFNKTRTASEEIQLIPTISPLNVRLFSPCLQAYFRVSPCVSDDVLLI